LFDDAVCFMRCTDRRIRMFERAVGVKGDVLVVAVSRLSCHSAALTTPHAGGRERLKPGKEHFCN
jgi:hypothetical protein